MLNPELEFQKSISSTKAWLHFEDGTSFSGLSNLEVQDTRWQRGIWGEAAFTTALTGYQETASDPSFLGQHIIFATAHVGNYPSDPRSMQSDKIHATSLIARNFSRNDFFINQDVVLFHGLDTRKLIRFLTSCRCSHKSVITLSKERPSQAEFDQTTLFCSELMKVSQNDVQTIIEGPNPIVLVNYGVKNSIIHELKKLEYPLKSVPFNTTAQTILSHKPRMVFLSNGPGDPRDYQEQVKVVKEILNTQIPVRAICLGHQLTALALGANTERLPFGHRGTNHPVFSHQTGEILITSQNHGYAVNSESLKNVLNQNFLNIPFQVTYRSLFDHSIEGIASTNNQIKTVQFHPEASPGPHDAVGFFTEIKHYLQYQSSSTPPLTCEKQIPDLSKPLAKPTDIDCVLLIGSGPIKIGQASEFDYSGTQACKALKQLGIKVILLNSNPATIMTDTEMAYQTYIEPITKETVKKIVQQEKIDAVISTMGGQTALNLCVELASEGFFEKNGIRLLGANLDTIRKTEDRELFAKELDLLGYKTGQRFKAASAGEALELAILSVGFPLIIRRDFALGGKGAALIRNSEELKELFTKDVEFPITMEKSLLGWKEIELEVMVDCEQNGVIICSIENVDPCGIHTGDSITVAPAQTISDRCYQNLRNISLNVAKHMGVVAGGANVQFAINPKDEDDIVVIEMNPRVSRSSALASKATGYPIAKISALLAIGFTLKDILNDITKASPVSFEPTLDYVAIKIPLFPFNKFPFSSQDLGPQMRSVGEVLALGGSFNEAFLKALRSLEMGLEIPSLAQLKTTPIKITTDYIKERLKQQRELSLLSALEALQLDISIKEVHELSGITPWFIEQMSLIEDVEEKLMAKGKDLDLVELTKAKQMGMSDKYIAYLTGLSHREILQTRIESNLFPVYKAVDTCSGEFKAETPYFYSTYSEENEAHSLSTNNRSVVILGSGPNRIGQGIEFDYSCVKSCLRLKDHHIKAIMINSNPETVSTDYDSSDRLYLSPLYSEDIFDIFFSEKPEGAIATFSGQTGIKIREHLEGGFSHDFYDFKFLGSPLKMLRDTEDRNIFADIIKDLDVSQTTSRQVSGYKHLVNAMTEIGFPVIIRPSYVIGGESMFIFTKRSDIDQLPEMVLATLKNSTTTFLVESYLENAIEYDVDLIRDIDGDCSFTICEHIEFAGVHSGDSGMITPPVVATHFIMNKLKSISKQLAEKLQVIGPVNFQFAVKDENVFIIEANPRGSRTIPFLSKAYNASLAAMATDAMLKLPLKKMYKNLSEPQYFSVKQSTFPFDRFLKDDIILGPKMRSTGETFGIDFDKDSAILKSYLGNYPDLINKQKVLFSLTDKSKSLVTPFLKAFLRKGYKIYATKGTADYFKRSGIACDEVGKIGEGLVQFLQDPELAMVCNTPENLGKSKSDGEYIRNLSITHGVPCFTRVENIKAILEALTHLDFNHFMPLSLQNAHFKRRDT